MVSLELTQEELNRFLQHPWSATGSGAHPVHPLQIIASIIRHVLVSRSVSYSRLFWIQDAT
jgi:hypothetical protein